MRESVTAGDFGVGVLYRNENGGSVATLLPLMFYLIDSGIEFITLAEPIIVVHNESCY